MTTIANSPPQQNEPQLDLSEVYACGDATASGFERLSLEADIDPDTLTSIVERITNLQREINKVAERAIHDLKPKRYYLDYLLQQWGPHLAAARRYLSPGKRTQKFGSAGIIQYKDVVDCGAKTFLKDGSGSALYVQDREALEKHFLSLPPEQLKDYGAELAVSFDTDIVLKACLQTGEMLPGMNRSKVIENGSWKVGVTKPWSERHFKILFNKALSGSGAYEDDESETL